MLCYMETIFLLTQNEEVSEKVREKLSMLEAIFQHLIKIV